MILELVMWAAAVGSRENPVAPTTPIGERLRDGSISDLDYPSQLLKQQAIATSVLAILIDPTGKVVECQPTGLNKWPILDTTACRLVTKRFRYRPMKGLNGESIWVTDIVKVHWQPPRR